MGDNDEDGENNNTATKSGGSAFTSCSERAVMLNQQQLEALLQQSVQAMEARHQQSMAKVANEWATRFDEVEAKLADTMDKLTETQLELDEARSPLTKLSKLVQVQAEQLVAVSDQCKSERSLIADMVVDMDNRFNMLVEQQEEKENVDEPSTQLHAAQKKVQEEMNKNLAARFDEQFDQMRKRIQAQDQQVEAMQGDFESLQAACNSLSREQNQMISLHKVNVEELTAKGRTQDGLLHDLKNAIQSVAAAVIAGDSNGTNSEEIITAKCQQEIAQDHERLMQAWGSQFDDLTTHVQESLDRQAASIADTRTSTFEHMDAEAQARAGVWNGQYNQLVAQVQQHGREIQDVKEDQERALIIVVETMVNLKLKVEEIVEQISGQESCQFGSDIDMQKIVDLIERKGKVWNCKFSKYTSELKALKERLESVGKETVESTRNHQEVQEILEQSIELFQTKTDTCFDLWAVQFRDLERRLQTQSNEKFARVEDHEKLKLDLSCYITTWNKQFLQLASQVERELAALNRNVEATASQDGSLLIPATIENNKSSRKVTFADIKGDQKKYKKALRQWREQRKASATAKGLLGSTIIVAEEIEFYDLTFIESREETIMAKAE